MRYFAIGPAIVCGAIVGGQLELAVVVEASFGIGERGEQIRQKSTKSTLGL
jgi:hypothetical protein